MKLRRNRIPGHSKHYQLYLPTSLVPHIAKLVGTLGNTESRVLAFIITDWLFRNGVTRRLDTSEPIER